MRLKKSRAYFRKWYKANKERMRAKRRLRDWARYHYPVPQVCQVRGCKKMGERHHPDYRKKKLIQWICKSHHEKMHHGKKYKLRKLK